MRREVKTLSLTILIGLLTLVFSNTKVLKAQTEPAKEPATAGTTGTTGTTAKKVQDGLVIDWLNDFEDCEDWRAVATSPLGDTKIRKYPGKPTKIKEDGNVEPEQYELTDENGNTHKDDYVIGVKTYFIDRGYDRVEVLPPNEYIIRGKAKEIRVWALGRKFRHTLYVKLRDYRGTAHKIKIGKLDFWGWREMSVIVPGWLPQSASYAMLDKNLHFVSLFVESDMYETPGTFYVYFDNLRVVTDLSEFTGDPNIRDNW